MEILRSCDGSFLGLSRLLAVCFLHFHECESAYVFVCVYVFPVSVKSANLARGTFRRYKTFGIV